MPNSITSRCRLRSFPAGGLHPLGSRLVRLEEKTACPDCALRGFTKVRFMVSLPLRTCLEKLPPETLPGYPAAGAEFPCAGFTGFWCCYA